MTDGNIKILIAAHKQYWMPNDDVIRNQKNRIEPSSMRFFDA